jgi:hypothetical protein
VKKSFAVESKDAVMDVNADDADGIRRKKAQVTWYARRHWQPSIIAT